MGGLEDAVPRDQDVSEYGRQNLWRDTAGVDAAKARDPAGRLELRAKADDEVAARDAYLGLEDVRVRGFFPLETDPRSFYASLAERSADVALKAGAITEAERSTWLDALHAQRARGPVIAGRLHIFVWGHKPT
jgi:hypothetical protein